MSLTGFYYNAILLIAVLLGTRLSRLSTVTLNFNEYKQHTRIWDLRQQKRDF